MRTSFLLLICACVVAGCGSGDPVSGVVDPDSADPAARQFAKVEWGYLWD